MSTSRLIILLCVSDKVPVSGFNDKIKVVYYRALYPFEARSHDEISIQPGDLVMVSTKHYSKVFSKRLAVYSSVPQTCFFQVRLFLFLWPAPWPWRVRLCSSKIKQFHDCLIVWPSWSPKPCWPVRVILTCFDFFLWPLPKRNSTQTSSHVG